MVNNHWFNNICRTINNNIHKDHDQFNKPVLNKQNKYNFTVFHQNFCGLCNKLTKKDLLNSLRSNSPQIFCIKEHHLIDEVLENITLCPCILGAKFCGQKHKCVGVCIFVQNNMPCTDINMDRYSNEKGHRNLCCKITYFIP
jgi:hypothetical protein